jgi:hypothetical protein
MVARHPPEIRLAAGGFGGRLRFANVECTNLQPADCCAVALLIQLRTPVQVMGRTRKRKAVTNSKLSYALVIFPRCDSDHCSYAALDILIGGCPTGHADSHRRMPVPLRSPTPAGPIVLDICDDPPRVLCAAERDEHLV